MFLRLLTVLLVAALLVGSAPAQITNVTIQPDLRLFTMMAALNAAGFDVEFGSQYHSVRETVRSYAKEVDADLLDRLKTFYRNRKGSQTDEAQLPKYISLAVNITDAPAFKPISREESLPPDARSVIGFLDLMKEYYQKAHLSQRWVELHPKYEEAMARVA